MAEPEYFIRQPDGSVQGPYPDARIRDWIEQGRVRPEMEFSTDNETWYAGHALPALFPDSAFPPLKPPSPPPAMPPPAPARARAPTARRSRPGPASTRAQRGGGEEGGRAARLVEQRAEKKRVLRQAMLPFSLGTVLLAAIATVCAFMPFSTIDVSGETVDVNGIDSNTGRFLIILACGGAVAALLALTGQNGRVTLMVAALALLGATAIMLLRLESTEEFREAGIDEVMAFLELYVDVEVITQPARWAAIAACALGTVVALIGSMRYASAERDFDRRQQA